MVVNGGLTSRCTRLELAVKFGPEINVTPCQFQLVNSDFRTNSEILIPKQEMYKTMKGGSV